MAARTSMATIISRVRRLIADRDPAAQVFGDQDIQDALDAHRTHVRYQALRPEGTRPPGGGTIKFLDYYADGFGQWEDTAQLTDGTFNLVAADTADLLTGHWSFLTSATWPIYVTGYAYDVYAAAADVLEEWASLLKLEFDFATHLSRFQRSQKAAACLTLAATYREKQMPMTAKMTRSDLHGTDQLGVLGFSGPWN